jgi:type 2 lantibiotic biosynthesis protein LanM
MVQTAGGRARDAAGADADLFSPEAWRDLERSLAARLSGFAAEALGALFDQLRGGRPDGFSVRLAEAGVGRETRRYEELVAAPSAWTRELPVLARLTATAADFWVRNSLELLGRWREDAAAVRREILGGAAPGDSTGNRVARIAAGLSDPHEGGRTVHVLTLEGGARVVYKPRGLGMDAAFARWLSWCNGRCGERGMLDFHIHRTLDRGGWGWAELVTAAPCPDAEAGRRFYLRAGQLLALLHVAGGRDAHFENLVAHGEHPVLIDLETWLRPRLARWLPAEEEGEGWVEAARRLEHSVLSTGLLPCWQPDGPRDDVVDVGGLSGGRPGVRARPVWRAVNTDRMVRVWGSVEAGIRPNVPVLDGRPLALAEHAREVRDGFASMYDLLLSRQDELLSPTGPFAGLEGCRARLVFRPTLAYKRLRDRSLRLEPCRDAAARGAELEALARVFLDVESAAGPPAPWPLLAAERRALEQGDVPVFRATVSCPSGTAGILEGPDGERIPGVIELPALEELRIRLLGLGAEDLAEQVGYIEAALGGTGTPTQPSPPSPLPPLHSPSPGEGRHHPSDSRSPLSRGGREGWRERGPGGEGWEGGTAAFLTAALELAESILARAIPGRDGTLGWIGPRYLAGGDTFELKPLGSDLYGGTAGIALFFAALSRVIDGGMGRWRDLALRIAAPLGHAPEARRGIGGLTGLGARIYTLTAIGELLGEKGLIDQAEGIAAGLDPEGDDRLDVMSGAAGALLALLALDASVPESFPKERAAACGAHLLGRFPWEGSTGFAHGAAGIAHALLRLAARTGDAGAREMAGMAIATERGLGLPPGQTTWCRGTAGIALARIGTLDILDDGATREEIRAALALTRSSPLTPMDHLCCGNLGRAEVLLAAGEILGEPELAEAARELARQVLARGAARGGLAWLPGGSVAGGSGFDPSFFRGAAGAGYTLLRLTFPHLLPCVLRLESPRRGRRLAGTAVDRALR